MANDNKRFLDKIGVQYLWDKINEYFSQIGHRHETSDVNGLDEYMEENAKAIRDTEKVVEELSEFPLYPSEENIGHVYLHDNKLYRAKRLPRLLLDFSQIEGHEDQFGNIIVNKTDIVNFINSQGLNIVDENYINIYNNSGEEVYELRKENNSLVFPFGYFLFFRQEDNEENTLYFKTTNFEVSAVYDDEENFGGVFYAYGDDLSDSHSYEIPQTDLPGEDIPAEHVNLLLSNSDIENFPMNYLCIGEGNLTNFLLYSLGIELTRCESQEDYEEGIFHDFLVWEEVNSSHIDINKVTHASEETTKRFYRERENNDIYVTDREKEQSEEGFDTIVIQKYGTQETQSIESEEIMRDLVDPYPHYWTKSCEQLTAIASKKYEYLSDTSEQILLTPLAIGTQNTYGLFELYTSQEVRLCFTPYISIEWDPSIQQRRYRWSSVDTYVKWEQVDGTRSGQTLINIPEQSNVYRKDYFDGDENYTKITIPASQNGIIISIVNNGGASNTQCLLHRIESTGEIIPKYTWSQVAKKKDIDDKINALPEVARTGSYTDLFNKPCIGDIQTYDYATDEDFPPIVIDSDNCEIDNSKDLIRRNNSLYTAILDESGLTLDFRLLAKERYGKDNKVSAGIYSSFVRRCLGVRDKSNNFYYSDDKTETDTVLTDYSNYYGEDAENGIFHGIKLGSANRNGVLEMNLDIQDGTRELFREVELEFESYSKDGEYTTSDGYVNIETTHGSDTSIRFKKDSDEITGYTNEYQLIQDGWTIEWVDSDEDRIYFQVYNSNGLRLQDFPLSEGDLFKLCSPNDEAELELRYVWDEGEDDYYYMGGSATVINYDWDANEPWPSGEGEASPIYKYVGQPQPLYKPNPVQKATVKLTDVDSSILNVYTTQNEQGNPTRVILKSIKFNDFRYVNDNNPDRNRDFERKQYWKQISGGGIKVIDLTGEN